MNRRKKRLTLGCVDITVITLTGLFSYLFLAPYLSLPLRPMVMSYLIIMVVYISLSLFFKIFDKINRYTSIRETIIHGIIVTSAFFLSDMYNLIFTPLSQRFLFFVVFISGVNYSGKPGGIGRQIEKLSKQLIDANLVHFIASDAHNISNRAFHMKEAYQKFEKEYGKEKLNQYEQVVKDLVNGEVVIPPTTQSVKKKKGFFGLF